MGATQSYETVIARANLAQRKHGNRRPRSASAPLKLWLPHVMSPRLSQSKSVRAKSAEVVGATASCDRPHAPTKEVLREQFRELMQAGEVLRHEERAEVHVSHQSRRRLQKRNEGCWQI